VTTDWRVVDGCLESTPVAFDPDDRYHRLGARIAEELSGPGIEAILLAGSAALRSPGDTPRDLDMTVLLADGATAPVPPVVTELPLDLLVLPAHQLRADPALSMTSSFRSLVLAGAWAPARLPAKPLALAQWKHRHLELRRYLAELMQLLGTDATDPDLVVRVQKRALRLIAPIALAQLGTYSIQLARCGELVAQILPEAGELARAVVEDLATGSVDLDANSRAVELSARVLRLLVA
jgi:hypothetical protein